VQTTSNNHKPTSAQAIAYFIKKSMLILEQHTSAAAGTKATFIA